MMKLRRAKAKCEAAGNRCECGQPQACQRGAKDGDAVVNGGELGQAQARQSDAGDGDAASDCSQQR